MAIAIGMEAPQFELQASNGKLVKLSDFIGNYVILYFYPKDMTPGCTTQACDFRDNYKEFSDRKVVIIGVSPDPLNRHEKFIEKHGLPFLLLSDENQHVAQLYDVWRLKRNFGKEYMGIERSTFVIDPNGKLIKEWRKVKVKGHVEEALHFISKVR